MSLAMQRKTFAPVGPQRLCNAKRINRRVPAVFMDVPRQDHISERHESLNPSPGLIYCRQLRWISFPPEVVEICSADWCGSLPDGEAKVLFASNRWSCRPPPFGHFVIPDLWGNGRSVVPGRKACRTNNVMSCLDFTDLKRTDWKR